MPAIDTAKQNAEMQAEILSKRLDAFVRYWAPRGPDLYEFQRDLMNVMALAMRHQNATMSMGIETYASQLYTEVSLRPLHVIAKANPDAPPPS